MNDEGWKGDEALDPPPAVQFWETVGKRIHFDELEVGEVFLIENAAGTRRRVAMCVGKDGDNFDCIAAPDMELPEEYKVWVMNI